MASQMYHQNQVPTVIYSFLETHPLISEILPSFHSAPSFHHLLINSNMDRRETRNGPSTSRDSFNGENNVMMRILLGMMNNQQ